MQNLLACPHLASTLKLVDKKTQQSRFSATLYDPAHPEKAELEAFIKNTFQQHYDAQIIHFYPNLLGARDTQGSLYAVAGYRHAHQQTLFLEQYLDAPIEQVLSELHGLPVKREHIVEIGNLATNRRGACRQIFQLLSLYFHSSDIRWVVFTGTRVVNIVVKRLQLRAVTLAKANEKQLADHTNRWGCYYKQSPHVMAMPVNQNIDPISHRYDLFIEADQGVPA